MNVTSSKPSNTPFTSLFFYLLEKKCPPLFLEGSLPFISSFLLASYPSICMSQGIRQDICPIKTLLKVVEGATSYEIIVQMSFPH